MIMDFVLPPVGNYSTYPAIESSCLRRRQYVLCVIGPCPAGERDYCKIGYKRENISKWVKIGGL